MDNNYMDTLNHYSLTINNRLPQNNFVSDMDQLLTMRNEDMMKTAKNIVGSKLVKLHIQHHEEIRQKFYRLLLNPSGNSLVQLSCDINANFIVQELMVMEAQAHAANVNAPMPLLNAIKELSSQFSLNRYGCRVLQRLIKLLPPEGARDLLDINFASKEFKMATDQNGNHIVQLIIADHSPDIYADFLKAMINSAGLCAIIEDKYGSRVLQCMFERIVAICEDKNQHPKSRKAAYEILGAYMTPFLKNALKYAQNEYANFLVQYIIKTEFFFRQRQYIVKEHLCHNILVLSQDKYASHVVEVAFERADSACLEAMFLEVLSGYEPDESGRTALHIMLFNQFGNYVMQRLLNVSMQICLGQRPGDPAWFHEIASYALHVRQRLARYSSGKKILETIQRFYNEFCHPRRHHHPLAAASPPQRHRYFDNQNNNSSALHHHATPPPPPQPLLPLMKVMVLQPRLHC